ncbi:hypothetical protein ACFYNO_26660 [Kitasatospora sp. NPDC006697]|uniref:hypothetical protein n=1 Tax=Kitasatospora sp. NPDC006697 TaxID=3364020 RepID=UPI003693A8EE
MHARLAGDPGAPARYAEQVAVLVEAHRRNRAAYYGQERRWPLHPFWARRQQPPQPPAPLRARAERGREAGTASDQSSSPGR